MISVALSRFRTSSALVGGLAPLMLGLASPAVAQDAQPAQEAPAAPATPATTADANAIVVTGSLIKNPNLVSAAPVLVTNRKEMELKQSNTAESLIRDVPGVVPGIGNAVNNGSGGFSTVNLRGLGDNRNVVLLDGTRIVPATLTGVTDLNDIPLALIERVDVLTGGNSTTYGADAVSGVVNFVTRKNFAGLEVDASQQLTQRGDGHVQRIDVTTGANFDDGRGNVVLGIGYQKSDAVYDGDRGFSHDSLDSASGEVGGSGTDVLSAFSLNGSYYQFNPTNGALVPAFSAYNFNPFNVLQTPFKRYNVFAQAHYQVTDHIEVFSRALYSQNTVDTIVAPSGSFGNTLDISLNSPFLSDAQRSQICAVAGVTPCDASTVLNGVAVRRRTSEVGNRVSNYRTNVFDYQAGLRGDITDRIKFNVYGAYGNSTNTQTLQGYTDIKRLQQGVLLNADGTGCADASNGCVPIDIFGPPGSITAQQAAFLQVESTTAVKTSLAQAHADISGDFGVSTPWASNPISFAVGTEYRKYKASQSADLLAQSPGELGGSGSAVIPFSNTYDVYEGFGELNAPIIQDKPGFESLSFDAGIRYSHYKIYGTENRFNTTTYKAGGVWEPVKGVKLRGEYSHAVRAPNINELFNPVAVGLTNLSVDPCQGSAPTTNATLRDVCLAQGAPASSIGKITAPSAGQVNILNSGNQNLKPEKANTYTLGAVIQPRVLPGFSATIDYYHIKITDAISAPVPGDSIAACFNNLSVTNPACLAIHRDPNTGGLDGDQAGAGTGLPGLLTNQGTLLTDGIDLALAYSRDIGFAKLGLNFNGNYTFRSKFKSSSIGLNRECVGYYSQNCGIGGGESVGSPIPKFQWSQRTTLDFGKNELSLLWRHIDSLNYEPQALADGADIAPQFRHIKPADYFDLTAQTTVNEHLTLTFEVENLLDRTPPIIGSTTGSTTYNSGNTYPATYDALGRRFVMTAKVNF
ncbi:MAG: TonB-dependent receptor plug domain-containing protein [Sphingomonas oligoaromativorans]